jgi:hypothetical protein
MNYYDLLVLAFWLLIIILIGGWTLLYYIMLKLYEIKEGEENDDSI